MDGMQLDWQVIGFGAVNLIAIVAQFYGLKADNRETAANAEKAIAKLSSEFTLALLTERSERVNSQATVKSDIEKLITVIEADVKEIEHRVTTIESGQSEWTKALRERTHELANKMQDLVLEIDRLKRPTIYGERDHKEGG